MAVLLISDIHDEEFKKLLEKSQEVINDLPVQVDRHICRKWVQKLCTMDSDEITVKRNRNDFFRYMMSVMQTGSLDGEEQEPAEEPPAGAAGAASSSSKKEEPKPSALVMDDDEKLPQYISHWSADRKTYVAAKPLPGKGAIIYMAVSQDPCYGWDIPGKRWSKR